jgi:3-oxoacyl-[acyl-carrier protein] reductase/pteridine reductase
MEISSKTALITGGAVRVGKAITLALAKAGANVVVHHHTSSAAAKETCAETRALGVQALALQADLSDPAQAQGMVKQALEHFGRVDILVFSASPFKTTPFPTQDLDAWRYVTRVLIDGAFYCANAVAPGMLERGEGCIVNILDLAAFEPWRNFAAHCVGKAGLWALTRQLALELAPKVRANAIAPGPVLPPEGLTAEKVARTAQGTLLGRWGSPDDVADAVLFAIRADYMTGEVITVDGGERWGRRKG